MNSILGFMAIWFIWLGSGVFFAGVLWSKLGMFPMLLLGRNVILNSNWNPLGPTCVSPVVIRCYENMSTSHFSQPVFCMRACVHLVGRSLPVYEIFYAIPGPHFNYFCVKYMQILYS